MIMTLEELRTFIDTDEQDVVLASKLSALELLIRKLTNNNFQVRAYRCTADIRDGSFLMNIPAPFSVGDTIQISESELNAGLYTITEMTDSTFTVAEPVVDEKNVLVTKVIYPMDVKIGVVNLMKWELNNRKKVGISSETLSRHSVTYFNMDGGNSAYGFPKSLTGFLKPYRKVMR